MDGLSIHLIGNFLNKYNMRRGVKWKESGYNDSTTKQ